MFALQQQQGHQPRAGLPQLRCRDADGAQFRLQQPQASIRIHALQQREVAVLGQQGRRGHPRQPVARQFGEHHPQAEGIQQLAQVHQVQPRLLAQQSVHPVAEGIAVDRHVEVIGQSHAQFDRDGAGAARWP